MFKQLLDKSQGQRSEWEYPFGAAGVNLTFLLQEREAFRWTALVLVAAESPGSPGQTRQWRRCASPALKLPAIILS